MRRSSSARLVSRHPRRSAVTDTSSKDPKKTGVPAADAAPLENLVADVLNAELGPEGQPKPAPAQKPEPEQAPIMLDMEEEPFVLDIDEAAPTKPEPEGPQGSVGGAPAAAKEGKPP